MKLWILIPEGVRLRQLGVPWTQEGSRDERCSR